jgi:glycerol-3-phosphate O-acyltransferase / dihydroxyacetone phosphate acyltransferase
MSGGNTLVQSSGAASNLAYDLALLFFRGIINVFFREVRPRGAFNIPRDGPVIFVGAPHSNQVGFPLNFEVFYSLDRALQFLDLLLALQVYRESGRRPAFLVAEKSMHRKVVGFLAKSLSSSAHASHYHNLRLLTLY